MRVHRDRMLNTWEPEATDSAVNKICATQEANDNHHFDESSLGRAASDISSKPTPTKFGTVKLPRSTFSSFSPFRCFDNPNHSTPIQGKEKKAIFSTLSARFDKPVTITEQRTNSIHAKSKEAKSHCNIQA